MKKKNILVGLGLLIPVGVITLPVACEGKKTDNSVSTNKTKSHSEKEDETSKVNGEGKSGVPKGAPEGVPEGVPNGAPEVDHNLKFTLVNEEVKPFIKEKIKEFLQGIPEDGLNQLTLLLYSNMLDIINYLNTHVDVLEELKNSSDNLDDSNIPEYEEYKTIIATIIGVMNTIKQSVPLIDNDQLINLFNEIFMHVVNNTYNQKIKSFVENLTNRDIHNWINLPKG